VSWAACHEFIRAYLPVRGDVTGCIRPTPAGHVVSNPLTLELTQVKHDKAIASAFLDLLDPTAAKFTFQLFGDEKQSRYAEILHGTLDEVWPKIESLNNPTKRIGVFIVVNETDGAGRKAENIKRIRALFIDADAPDQVQRCEQAFSDAGLVPCAAIQSSPGKAHYYFAVDDVAIDQFKPLQQALIQKLGTDVAVKDISRVMRLPGTLHLKDPAQPHLVRLVTPSAARSRWQSTDLIEKLDLKLESRTAPQAFGEADLFGPADRVRLRKLFGAYLNDDGLSAGIQTNTEEIRSAVTAIPGAAIAAEADWMKIARALAHEARIYKPQAEDLYKILNEISARAPNYDAADNRLRWERYVEDAGRRDNPITIATLLALAKQHGWTGWVPGPVTSQSNTPAVPTSSQPLTSGLAVTFSNVRHRRLVYGIDLYRGEITVLAAPGGTGKSSYAIGVSAELAANKSVLGEKIWIHQPKVLYVNGEDSKEENVRRIWSFCLKHHIRDQDIQRLHFLGSDDWRTQQLSFLRSERGNSVLDGNGVTFLEHMLDAVKPDLLVLDPLLAFCGGGNVNDNAVMALVMRALKRLANKFNCAVLILHHTRKGGEPGSAEAVSGASSIVNLARRAISVVPMTKEEATKFAVLPSEYRKHFKIVSAKANLVPPSDVCPWYKLESVTLPNAEPPTYPKGDNVQAVVRVNLSHLQKPVDQDDQKIRRAILDVVAAGKLIGGSSELYSPNVSGAKNDRALMPDAMAAVQNVTSTRTWHSPDLEAVVRGAIDALKSEGALVDEKIKGGRYRRARGLKVLWSRTAWPEGPSATQLSPDLGAAEVEMACDQVVNGQLVGEQDDN
jgi:hypothetical protein